MYGGCLNQGLGLILPACGETRQLPRGATLAAPGAPPLVKGCGGGEARSMGLGLGKEGIKNICILHHIQSSSKYRLGLTANRVRF